MKAPGSKSQEGFHSWGLKGVQQVKHQCLLVLFLSVSVISHIHVFQAHDSEKAAQFD